MEAEFASNVHHIEANIHAEASLVLSNQQQSVVAQAEAHIQTQQQRMLVVEQEEANAFKAQIAHIEQHASSKYDQLHSDATEVVQQQQANMGTLWSELRDARVLLEKHEADRKQNHQILQAMESHNQDLQLQLKSQRMQSEALEQEVANQAQRTAMDEDDNEKEDLVRELEALRNAMQDLQITNKELRDQLAKATEENGDWQLVKESPPVYTYQKYQGGILVPDQDGETLQEEFRKLPFCWETDAGDFEMRGTPDSGDFITRKTASFMLPPAPTKPKGTDDVTEAIEPPPDAHHRAHRVSPDNLP